MPKEQSVGVKFSQGRGDRCFRNRLLIVKILTVLISQMDAATAKVVDAAMSEAFRDATVITIAHRLPAVLKTCDKVVVLSEGRVVEEGRPR